MEFKGRALPRRIRDHSIPGREVCDEYLIQLSLWSLNLLIPSQQSVFYQFCRRKNGLCNYAYQGLLLACNSFVYVVHVQGDLYSLQILCYSELFIKPDVFAKYAKKPHKKPHTKKTHTKNTKTCGDLTSGIFILWQ